MLLQPARSVHTFGMRFAIDVAHVDADMRVLRLTTMAPNRLGRPVWRARARDRVRGAAPSRRGACDVGDQLELR